MGPKRPKIREKRQYPRIGTLRQEYGTELAPGYRSDTKLETTFEDRKKFERTKPKEIGLLWDI